MQKLNAGIRYGLNNVNRTLEIQPVVFEQKGVHDGTTVVELLLVVIDKLETDSIEPEAVDLLKQALDIIASPKVDEPQ